jgi:hypothetical protein
MALRELLATFGIEVDDKDLKAFDQRLDSVTSKVKALAGAFVGGALASGIGKFVNKQVEAGFKLDKTAESLGISTDELQAWRHSAEMAGEGAELFDQAARMMLKNAGMSRVGIQSAADEMARWKMRVTDARGKVKPFNALLLDFADHLKAMPDRARQTRAAMAVFGFAGAKAIPWLTQGSKVLKSQLNDYRMLGGGMSREFVEAAKKTELQLIRLKFALTAVKSGVLQQVLPWVEKGAMVFIRWSVTLQDFLKHTNAVQTAIQFLAAGIGGFAALKILKGAAAAAQLLRVMIGLRGVGTLPQLLLGGAGLAALVGLYLLIEDISVAIEGGNSSFRKFLDDMLGVEGADKFLTDLKANWDLLKDEFQKALPDIQKLGQELIKAFESAMPYITKFIEKALPALINFARTAVAAARAAGAALTGDFEGAGKIIDQIGEQVVGSGSVVGKLLEKGALHDAEGNAVMPGSPEYERLKSQQATWNMDHAQPVWQGPVQFPKGWQGPVAEGGARPPVQVHSNVEAKIEIKAGTPQEAADAFAAKMAQISGQNNRNAATIAAVLP